MSKKVSIILIAGGSASGKTTIASKIANEILKDKSVEHISMDNYYKDFSSLTFEQRNQINFDHPNSIDIDLLIKDLKQLLKRQDIFVPTYDFTKHIRTDKEKLVKASDVIIVDGIFSLHFEKLRELGDIKIFVKTPDDLRFIRRLVRDIKERNRTIESVIDQYLTDVKPMHDLFIEQTIDYADIVIPFKKGNDVAIDIVASKIKDLLS
ncbi:uridine kinase [Mycoplasma feriruminatoris]|uniref:Uridine kinase n=1 Tax=Mycoplasma feriruminatoris TaxID=1179777 RepID=A0AAQ3DPV8_9MOLU|nr:uridine kinase [Mycoplasma feriruminatoris]UKS54054.1 uridine kinase [Mycoplasma feriruminatoris]WFQ90119.1 Uridine kinase [Mycoplasma feriruminatoris]WFQ90940.1 uridine kinase [Mycoplasma feriruminatoris]WFQ91762.1 Uridine kinase [Mycoplasma feriruminatoris]WFQ92585.1 Uridine kinase [Mycoplasma feriruminatoris]